MAYNLKPRTREENFLGLIAENPNAVEMAPITRKEKILANMAGAEYEVTPRTRKECFMNDVAENGGGVTPTGTIEITENGTGIDVAQYAYADVSVPGSSINWGTVTIQNNTGYKMQIKGINTNQAFAEYNLSNGGTYDVLVPLGPGYYKIQSGVCMIGDSNGRLGNLAASSSTGKALVAADTYGDSASVAIYGGTTTTATITLTLSS